MTPHPRLVPELIVSDLARSLAFYVGVLRFTMRYQRHEDGFAYLSLDGADLMLEEARDTNRAFVAGALEPPYGRGINFQIEVRDADALYERVAKTAARIFLPLESRWYRVEGHEEGNRQFIVQDPDGYLLRFWSDLGNRSDGN